MILKSRFVVPVDGPVIENGAVIIRDGRIAAVGPAASLSDEPVRDYGDAVICPGLVNAHTHLELTPLERQLPPSADFVDWLAGLMDILQTVPVQRESVQTAMSSGIENSLSAGVTALGDITRAPQWTRSVLAESPLRGVSFGEVIAIGKRRHMLSGRLADAASVDHQTERIRTGIAPHAPYTIEPDAMRACAEKARLHNTPLCIHLAESSDEESFTRSRTGKFVTYLQELGVWDEWIPTSGCGPVELASETGLLTQRTVIAHANYVTDSDISLIADAGASVAYCPRTHQAFEHQAHRFRDMLAVGVNVCIGTDSLASNPSLSILEELRCLHDRYPEFPPGELIAMGTIRGARALDLQDAIGSFTVGKAADLVVVTLESADGPVRWETMFETPCQVAALYIDGVLQIGKETS
jgi:cytosine/adenosine deaminase-related metal-dependent hydrolase